MKGGDKNMAFARTQKGAKERVRMKRAIRRTGHSVKSDATTIEIRKKYKKYVVKK